MQWCTTGIRKPGEQLADKRFTWKFPKGILTEIFKALVKIKPDPIPYIILNLTLKRKIPWMFHQTTFVSPTVSSNGLLARTTTSLWKICVDGVQTCLPLSVLAVTQPASCPQHPVATMPLVTWLTYLTWLPDCPLGTLFRWGLTSVTVSITEGC